MTSEPGLLHTRHLNEPQVLECPWDYYAAMHSEGNGFYYDTHLQMYICADYGLMREIMRNTRVFSSVDSQNVAHMRKPPAEVLAIQAQSQRQQNILVSQDPPDHTRIRKLLDDPFRPRAIEAMRPQIVDIVNIVIDGFIDRGEFDAVAEFGIPIPITVIADILGIDRSYAQTIKSWSDASVEPLGMMLSDERWIECAQIMQQFQDFMTAELQARAQQPSDDFLSHLAHARDDAGQPLTLAEQLGITQQVLVAGNETTTNGIAGGVQLLAENPRQQHLLRAHPERMLTFVNEALRLESPVQGLFRITRQEVELKGVTVPAGSRIMLRYAAANRDADKYACPNDLDIFRSNAGTQVGFGAGVHHCLGANLAREEMLQAFTLLLDRTQELRLQADANDLAHHPSMILRGLRQLQVSFS